MVKWLWWYERYIVTPLKRQENNENNRNGSSKIKFLDDTNITNSGVRKTIPRRTNSLNNLNTFDDSVEKPIDDGNSADQSKSNVPTILPTSNESIDTPRHVLTPRPSTTSIKSQKVKRQAPKGPERNISNLHPTISPEPEPEENLFTNFESELIQEPKKSTAIKKSLNTTPKNVSFDDNDEFINSLDDYTPVPSRPSIQYKNPSVVKNQEEMDDLPVTSQSSNGGNVTYGQYGEQSISNVKIPKDSKPVSEIIQSNKNGSKKRKQGLLISNIDPTDHSIEVLLSEKDERTTNLLRNALIKNEFIRNLLDEEKLASIIQAMYPEVIKANTYIINEGETGSHLYVSDEGKFDIIQNAKLLKSFGPGEAFGELAVLYKAKRFASVITRADSRIWLLERKVFQKIMVRSRKQEEDENIKFLSLVPDLKNVHPSNIIQMAGFLKRKFYPGDMPIIRQGETGDTFFIIKGGSVIVSKHSNDGQPDEVVSELSKGDYFGEQALIKHDVRSATITAKPPGVECLLLERGPFNEYLGDIESLRKRRETLISPPRKTSKSQGSREYNNLELDDLQIITTLGVGAFGRVQLAQSKKNENITFALKRLKKYEMVTQQLEIYAFNEKNILFMCKSPFICRLYRTYKDNKYLYFLMEPLLGGDVWSVIQKTRGVGEETAKFITGCVVEAFEYLHNRCIIYRDLKPENVMLDYKGYAKLVDFGYAKVLPYDSKTYTFAGTPEYVAPEIVLGNPYDRAVDYWTLGVFIYELLAGKPPFRGTNHVNTYSMIVSGIEGVKFSHKINNMALSIIRKLCKPLPVHRLGYLRRGIKDIKTHKWFYNFEWKKLKNCKLTAPLIMPIAHNTDTKNFEHYEDDAIPPDEYSGWDEDF